MNIPPNAVPITRVQAQWLLDEAALLGRRPILGNKIIFLDGTPFVAPPRTLIHDCQFVAPQTKKPPPDP